MNPRFPLSSTLAILAAAMLAAGCNSSSSTKSNTQVVAKVNGDEISLHQVNHVLARSGEVPPEKLDLVRKAVVDRLIDQELLASKAVEAKLDRTPDTLVALEMARQEILARAYADHLVASRPKLDMGEVVRYYERHPELFRERNVYTLQELTLSPSAEVFAELQALIQQKPAIEKVQEFLQGKNVTFKSMAGAVPAERVPSTLLKQLHHGRPGDLVMTRERDEVAIVRLVAAKPQPVEETVATPVIKRKLASEHVAKIVKDELTELKQKSKIEYVGSFAHLAKAQAEATAASRTGAAAVGTSDAAMASPTK